MTVREKTRSSTREARKHAVDAEILPGEGDDNNEENPEVEILRAKVAELEMAMRTKAAHEHEIKTGNEKITDTKVLGAGDDIKASLRELLKEYLPERDVAREPVREQVRTGAVVAYDREGNPIYRKRDALGDRFSIPEDLKEPGWSYQWCRISVHGQEDISNQVNMQENGWRFVPAERPGWAGRFMPVGYKGHIFQDGLALMERPASLTKEAQDEQMRAVRDQSRAQREQFGLALPDGFTSETPAARQFTFARTGKREAAPESWKPDLGRRVVTSIDD